MSFAPVLALHVTAVLLTAVAVGATIWRGTWLLTASHSSVLGALITSVVVAGPRCAVAASLVSLPPAVTSIILAITRKPRLARSCETCPIVRTVAQLNLGPEQEDTGSSPATPAPPT